MEIPPESRRCHAHVATGQTPAALSQSLLDGKKRIYSAVSVKDGQGSAWDGNITPADLKTTLGKNFRLTALDCFEEKKKTFCAAAWVDNPTSIQWNWGIDLTASQVNQRLKKDDGKLISIRAYKTTLGGELAAPKIRYCAIWVKDDGVEWGWIPDAVADSIDDTLDLKSARLISIDNLDNTRGSATTNISAPSGTRTSPVRSGSGISA